MSSDSISLPAAPNLFVDGFRELTAVVYDKEGAVLPDVVPTWASSKPDIAKVSANGIVTGEAPGTAIITAAVGRQAVANVVVTVVPHPDTVIVVAHRGFPNLFPENTLVAVNGAFEKQADAIEVDVRWTRDGIAVLMHDATVDRTTDGTGPLNELTYAQVQQLDACYRFKPRPAPCPVPTLRSVLEAARGRGRLVLDLNAPYPADAFPSLLAEIREVGMEHDVIIICFSSSVLRQIRTLDPAIPLGLLTTSIPQLSDVKALGGRVAAMPFQSALLADPVRGQAFVESAAANRIAVGTWVASGLSDAQAIVALGVRHITSDVPLDKRYLQP